MQKREAIAQIKPCDRMLQRAAAANQTVFVSTRVRDRFAVETCERNQMPDWRSTVRCRRQRIRRLKLEWRR